MSMSAETGKRVGLIIQVRLGSSRLQGKALLPIAGRPLLLRLIEHLSPLKDIGDIIVATTKDISDNPIVEIAEKNNIRFYRGSLDDAISRFIGAAEQFNKDIIVRVTGDNPLTDPTHIRLAVDTLERKGLDYVGTKGLPLGTNAEVCTLEALRNINSLDLEAIHRESITSYLYTHPDIYKCKIIKVEDECLYRPTYRLTVDTKEDLQLMEAIYSNTSENPSLRDAIKILDENPNFLSINAQIEQRRLKLS